MSVMTLSLTSLKTIFEGLVTAAHRVQCDQWYSDAIRAVVKNKDIYKELNALLNILMNLNNESYEVKYEKTGSVLPTVDFERGTIVNISIYQVLKSAECLRYNIEKSTIEQIRTLTPIEVKALKVLDDYIDDIRCGIIAEIPAYKNAKWND